MKILFYSKDRNQGKGSIHEAMMDVAHPDKLEFFSSPSRLSARLRQPRFGDGSEILVISACNRRELLNLKAMENAFKDIPLILVLPDREEERISIGQSLFPRLLWFRDGQFKELKTVLAKLAFWRTCQRALGLQPAKCQNGKIDERA